MQHGIVFYREIFSRAWRTAHFHKEVWLIAALAGLANTGTVMESVYRLFYKHHPESAVSFSSFGRWLQEHPIVGHYTQAFVQLPVGQMAAVLFLLTLILLAFAVAIFGAQQLTVLTSVRASNSQTPLPPRLLMRSLSHIHFLRLALLNAMGAAGMLVLFGACGLVAQTLATGNTATDLLSWLSVYLLALPAAFAINLFTILCVIESVRKDEGIQAAIASALKALHHHWLMGVEIAGILFAVNLVLSTVIFAAVLGVTFFLSFLVAMAVSAHHVFIGALLAMVSASFATAVVVCYGGFITLFNYTTWTQFLQAIEKKSVLPVVGNMVKSLVLKMRA